MTEPKQISNFLREVADEMGIRYGAEASEFRDQLRLQVGREKILPALAVLKDEFGFKMLSFITAVDYWPDETPRFHVVYQVNALEKNETLRLRVPVVGVDAVMPSAVDIFQNANWHEREIYDMFGIRFESHPDLRRILMPFDWVGHPLRKDYPLSYEEVQFTFNFGEIEKRKPKPRE
jgi:NADH-quinone oxidoreductase subunit C